MPTGTLAATTPDTATQPLATSTAQPLAAAAPRCANCGTPLSGRYCGECGQRHHDHPIHDFWHFVGEATEDLTHADSRLWQTLIALLFRPGFLTQEFLEGRRARYLPPVRLYLVVSVIFFVLAGLQSRLSTPQAAILVNHNGHFQYEVVPLSKSPRLGTVAHAPAAVAGGAVAGLSALAQTQAGRQRLCEQTGTYIRQNGGWLAGWGPRVEQSCLAAIAEGGMERMSEAVEHNLERALFLLLPLLALVMKPLYRRPPRHYVEHLLFFLHDHAFLFVVFGAATLLALVTSSAWVLDPIDLAITIYIPVYYYRAMRRVYGQGVGLTLCKLGALGVTYFFLGIVMFTGTFLVSFLSL